MATSLWNDLRNAPRQYIDAFAGALVVILFSDAIGSTVDYSVATNNPGINLAIRWLIVLVLVLLCGVGLLLRDRQDRSASAAFHAMKSETMPLVYANNYSASAVVNGTAQMPTGTFDPVGHI